MIGQEGAQGRVWMAEVERPTDLKTGMWLLGGGVPEGSQSPKVSV